MNILDINLDPLTIYEMSIIKTHYSQNFDNMDMNNAIKLLKLLMTVENSSTILDSETKILLIRRLHMIINWTEYPERLL